MSSPTHKPRGIVVFGGGTATNSLVDIFERIREQRGCSLSYVIPISDNGGSSSELIRMFGGPGAYLLHSRLVLALSPFTACMGRICADWRHS